MEAHLWTRGLPELDLLIRTSGERRISNFLLWQAAYAELYFTDVLCPDFRDEAFLGGAGRLPGAAAALRPHRRAARRARGGRSSEEPARRPGQAPQPAGAGHLGGGAPAGRHLAHRAWAAGPSPCWWAVAAALCAAELLLMAGPLGAAECLRRGGGGRSSRSWRRCPARGAGLGRRGAWRSARWRSSPSSSSATAPSRRCRPGPAGWRWPGSTAASCRPRWSASGWAAAWTGSSWPSR